MNKTLREASNQSVDAKISEIKLMFANPISNGMKLVIVEGDDDRKMYSRVFDKKTVRLHPVDGCAFYEDILSALNEKYKNRMIAIKDADFDRLQSKTYDFENLFLTEGHDAEIMAADSDFEEFLQTEYLNGADIPLISSVEEDIKHLSYIKWCNSNNQYGLNVERLHPVKELYDGNVEISIKKCLKWLYSDQQNADKQELKEEDVVLFEKNNSTNDYPNLTNGHDLFDGICRKLYCEMNSRNVKKGIPQVADISRLARASFSLAKFSKTKIYEGIIQWQTVYGCSLFG